LRNIEEPHKSSIKTEEFKNLPGSERIGEKALSLRLKITAKNSSLHRQQDQQ
jgi:hypothetical protein